MTTSIYQNSELLEQVPWQTPVITEKSAFLQLSTSKIANNFLPVPWATLIDWSAHGTGERKKIAKHWFSKLKKMNLPGSFTVCQHYKYEKIIPTIRKIGCTALFTPHATYNHSIKGINILPFPLFAANTPKPIKYKKLLYSFVGASMEHYISPIREVILTDNHPDNTAVVRRGKWQFNNEVYNQQVTGKSTTEFDTYLAEQNKVYYNRILKNSRYSLCPSGAGPASIRFYESLACGSIPIILADTWKLPVVNGVDWDKCTIRLPENEYYNLRPMLRTIDRRKERSMSESAIKAFKLVSGNNITKCVTDYYS